MFNKQKFLSFYPNNLNAEKCWDLLESEFKIGNTGSNCPTCGQVTQGVNPMIMAGALATIRVEVGKSFTPVRENLNYSANGLLATFPKYFTKESAQKYSFNPEMIANRVYANRMGNGDEASGDGWRHRGTGWIQFTGKDNHTLYGFTDENALDFTQNARALVRYFKDKKVIDACLSKDWDRVRVLVNGGLNGIKEFRRVINDYTN